MTDTRASTGSLVGQLSMLNPPKDPIPGIVDCAAPINAGSHMYELRAALDAVNRWLVTGRPPPESPRLEVNPANHQEFRLDGNGNALGGIRSPEVAAPVAKLSGVGQPGSGSVPANAGADTSTVSGQALCGIFGTTVPFSPSKMATLYRTHAAFVTKWDEATAAEVKQGYVLSADADALDKVAAHSNVGE